MADAEATKKYYWLKLKRDFFKRHDIRIVEEMPNGKDYALFYLKMLVESIDHEGELRFSETIPYNEQMLSVITNTNIDIVRSAMKLFIELKMIDLFDDKTIYMSEVQKMIGNETAGAERVRKHRARTDETKRLLQCNIDVTKSNTEIELDTEPKKEPKKDTSSAAAPAHPKTKYGQYGWVKLTGEEYDRLALDLGPEETARCIQYVDESAEKTGNKNQWKNWNLVVRNCSRDGWHKRYNKPEEPQRVYQRAIT